MRQPTSKKLIMPVLMLALLLPATAISADELSAPELPEVIYIVPFLNVMMPSTIPAKLFDSFIDEMMAVGNEHGITIRILKQDIDTVDREWLAKQTFVTGELFDYDEDVGCCSTEISARVRAYLYRSGSVEPAGEFNVPGDAFYDHDRSTLDNAQVRMAGRMARQLTGEVYAALVPAQ